jgi:hypothetical protein
LPIDEPVFEAVREHLARLLGVDPLSITRVELTAQDWPDACLGLAQPDEMCAQVIVPGYRALAETDGTTHECHTNGDGSLIRCREGGN